MKTKPVLFTFCMILISVYVVFAQWIPVNPPRGGVISSLAIDGNNIYFGGPDGVFRTTDGGATRTVVYSGLKNYCVISPSVAVCGNRIFAGTRYGVFMSSDSGTSWTAFNSGIKPTIQGKDGYRISNFAVSGNNIFCVNDNKELLRSSNIDTSWSLVAKLPVLAIFFAVNDSNFLVGGSSGVIQSTDNGTHWNRVETGYDMYSDKNPGESVYLVAMTDSLRIIATEVGVFRSVKNDTTWTKIAQNSVIHLPNAELYKNPLIVAIGDTLFAACKGSGIYKLTKNDTSWAKISNTPEVNCLAASGDTLVAGTDSQILLSTNRGISWRAFDNNYIAYGFGGLTVLKNGNIFTNETGALYLSTNKGTKWTRVLPNWDVSNSWSWPTEGGGSPGFAPLAALSNDIFVGGSRNYVHRSVDNGTSWTGMYNVLSTAYSFHVSNNKILAISKLGEAFLYTDGDIDFSDLGIDFGYDATFAVNSNYMFANGGSLLNNDKRLYRLAINDSNWTVCAYPGDTNTLVSCLVASDRNLFAGTNNGLFVSANDGTSWKAVNDGIDTAPIYCLAVSGTKLFAGRPDGVYISTDNGTRWTAVNGLTDTVTSFGISDSTIFITTTKNGEINVFQRPLSDMDQFVTANLPEKSHQERLKMFSVGTANSHTTISLTLPHSENVNITAYTLSGIKIVTLVNENIKSGLHNVAWDTRNLATGVYVLRMQAGKTINSTKTFKIGKNQCK
jgi:photosystem II stability/assembly factor-like uncharacterized protein